MSLHLVALVVAANDPPSLVRFWAGLLGRETDEDGLTLLPDESTGLRITFERTDVPKAGLDRMHLHLTSASHEDQRATVDRVLELGGHHLDVGQRPEEGHVVLADPEGNEFCVTEPGNAYLAGCGFLGELACDGSREVGRFWSGALGWPLVWDRDEETAIQSPAGGTKISWGGPPVAPKVGRNRLHLDVAPRAQGDQVTEVDRLVALGATQVDDGRRTAPGVMMADPDGNEFCVLTPR
ncbi:VOC family protein [Sanguibacter sp. 25GB23B1]|uniref:VOC family protein n=1 Tax=unclassified Sanguibacter TaxID=2645534 RepID=UPI0032AED45C